MSPAVAPARVVKLPRRVQGIDQPLSKLTLRGGRSLAVEIGGSILPTPTLRRGLGNSAIDLTIHNPDLRWLRLSMASQKWDASIDGLWFRYIGCSKQGKSLTLRFEDRDVARLRERRGPKKAYRSQVTRAEFICQLVEEMLPRVPIVCPERAEKQPIASREDSAKAKDSAREDRGAGLGDVKGLRVKGVAATKAQLEMGDRVLRIAEHEGAPHKVMVSLIAACIIESLLGKVSPNLLQVESFVASAGNFSATDVEASVRGYLRGYVPGHTGALAYHRSNPDAPAYEIAQAVQRSGAGQASNGAGNYGPHVEEAREWVEEYAGGSGGGGDASSTQPYTFEVGEKETYWQAIQRLAKEVNWRAFFIAGRFFYISEPELLRSQVRLAIGLDADGNPTPDAVENVDFDFNVNKPVTTATVTAYAGRWGAPPGSVVTLAGYGPASIGSGSPPVKANSKGQRMGVAAAQRAKTGEGKGRYLVAQIEVPLTGETEARLATISLRKPTAPLPEPAAESASQSGGASGGSGTRPAAVDRMLKFAEGEIGKPYAWGGYGPDSYDCSGFVSKVLNVGGVLSGRLTTSALASWGKPGPGEWITVHDKVGTGSARTEHVVIEIDGTLFEAGGISDGVGRPSYSRDALAAFSVKRHPEGM